MSRQLRPLLGAFTLLLLLALVLGLAPAKAQAQVATQDAESEANAVQPGDEAERPTESDGESSKPPAVDEPELPAGLDDEPELPAGLDDEPELPAGLDDEPELPAGLDDEPELPAGLEDKSHAQHTHDDPSALPLVWNAFIDMRAGLRVQQDRHENRASLGELRVQVHGEKSWEPLATAISLTADLLFDPVLDAHAIDLESGDGAIDLRDANLVTSPLVWMDLKIGRQVLTWGTGDLLFINDMFPKDWNAFLIGRELEYLKAPSDALKLSLFHSLANLDLICTPRFDADRYPDRRRLSSFDPLSQSIVGRETPLEDAQPNRWFQDNEFAARVYRRVGRTELALYGYRGYWKSPGGFDATSGRASFPTLSVYGMSARRALLGGIAHAEGGYYDSRSDRDGDDPLVRNSETRGLLGFEREARRHLTIGLQYYVELMRYHQAYERGLPPGAAPADRARHVATLRVQYAALQEDLQLSLFMYLSPSDQDVALLPAASYALTPQPTRPGETPRVRSRAHAQKSCCLATQLGPRARVLQLCK